MPKESDAEIAWQRGDGRADLETLDPKFSMRSSSVRSGIYWSRFPCPGTLDDHGLAKAFPKLVTCDDILDVLANNCRFRHVKKCYRVRARVAEKRRWLGACWRPSEERV